MEHAATVELTQLERIVSLFSAVEDYPSFINNLESILEAIVHVEYTGLYLINPDTEALELLHARGLTEEERLEAERTAMVRHPGRVFLTQEPILVQDTEKVPDATQSSVRSSTVRSRLFLPVMSQSRCIGTFGLGSSKPNTFTQQHILTLSFLCKIAGIVYVQIRQAQKHSRLEEQLRHSQKLEVMGRLAGGIAHEFNNHLTVIQGLTEMLMVRTQDPRTSDELRAIFQAARAASSVTNRLLSFSRKEPIERRIFAPHLEFQRLVSMLQPLLRDNIELEVSCVDVGVLQMDLTEFEQAVLNLSINSADAMPHGGKLLIALESDDRPPRGLTRPPNLVIPAGIEPLTGGIRILVRDNGIGMDAKLLTKIFEPFFTTKKRGSGTGMGLAIVSEMVEALSGTIRVWSTLGEGTTVTLSLPGSVGIPDASSPSNDPSSGETGQETILIVEDEGMIRRLLERTLQNLGYHTILAEDGLDGLEAFDANRESIALIITDLIMPRMDGLEMTQHISRAHPNIPVLFISGYTDALDRQGEFQELNAPLLRKPFATRQLLKHVKHLLYNTQHP